MLCEGGWCYVSVMACAESKHLMNLIIHILGYGGED